MRRLGEQTQAFTGELGTNEITIRPDWRGHATTTMLKRQLSDESRSVVFHFLRCTVETCPARSFIAGIFRQIVKSRKEKAPVLRIQLNSNYRGIVRTVLLSVYQFE